MNIDKEVVSSRPFVDNFWKRVTKTETCWMWEGAKAHFGHGMVKAAGQSRLAHRVSWTIENGDIPDGMLICHHCDIPGCVRPSHLFIGTHLDNVRDTIRKGRRAKSSRELMGLCKSGHPATPENSKEYVTIKRECRICTRESRQKRARERDG